MGLVPKVKGLFCTGYINKIGFCPGSGIGMEIASYKGRSQVRHRCLYLAGKNQEDDENAEKRRSFPQPGKTAAGGEKEAVGRMASQGTTRAIFTMISCSFPESGYAPICFLP